MNSTIYVLSQILIILTVLGVIGAILYSLQHAFRRLAIPNRQDRLRWISLGLLLWLLILAIAARLHLFHQAGDTLPKLVWVLLPGILLIGVLTGSKSFGSVLKMIPTAWLIKIQVFRIGTEAALWLGYKGGFVPLQMTFEWLNQDIVVGLTALLAGHLFFERRLLKFQAIIWNFFGILLTINFLWLAFTSVPNKWQLFFVTPHHTILSETPFIWILGFSVPFALAMHIFCIKRLLMRAG
ncbi:MAG: hypothetical protein HC892_06050 [Saprospiraceae bacterium]|nr:hypothetical protein [Saprospiraceae bacterium]